TSRVFGVAAGADYLVSPRTIAGFALAGGGTNFSVAYYTGTGHSDLFQAGAFVRHTVGPLYISAALVYGWQDVTTDRTVTIAGVDQLRAHFNANTFSGRVEGGYGFVTPWIGGIGITPYAAGIHDARFAGLCGKPPRRASGYFSAIRSICARPRPFSTPEVHHNQTDPTRSLTIRTYQRRIGLISPRAKRI
ncbi:MAG: autotransporter protein, partial [Tardiphaga sp.]|nr:autotransporter protein [Tardiphaga sp.]